MKKQVFKEWRKDIFPAIKWPEIVGASGLRKKDSKGVLISTRTLKNGFSLT